MNFSYGRKFPQGGGVIFPGSIFPGGEVLFLERISRTYAPTRCFELF